MLIKLLQNASAYLLLFLTERLVKSEGFKEHQFRNTAVCKHIIFDRNYAKFNKTTFCSIGLKFF